MVRIEDLGSLLFDLVRETEIEPEAVEKEDSLQSILTLVTRQANIDFKQYKPSTIVRRIGRRMTVTHNLNIAAYAEYLLTRLETPRGFVKEAADARAMSV